MKYTSEMNAKKPPSNKDLVINLTTKTSRLRCFDLQFNSVGLCEAAATLHTKNIH